MMFFKNLIKEIQELQFIKKIILLYILALPIMKISNLLVFKQKIQFSEATFLLIFICFLYQLFKKKLQLNIDIIVKLAIFLILSFVPSFINAQDKLLSSIEFIGIFYLIIMFLIISQLIETMKFWLICLKVWMFTSLIVVFTGIVGYLNYFVTRQPNLFVARFDEFKHINNMLHFRISSFFLHPNMLASYIHVGIIFVFILLIIRKYLDKKSIKGSLLTLLLFLFTIWLCKTRIIAGVFLSLFLCFLPFKEWYFRFFKYISFMCTILSIIFVILITTWWTFPLQFNLDAGKHVLSIKVNTLRHTYFVRNKAALKMIKEHPFLGVGMGGYNKASLNYIDWNEAMLSYKMLYPESKSPYDLLFDPHSTLLGWTAETGIFGFTGIIAFFVGFLIILIKEILTSGDQLKKYTGWFFMAGFFGFFINSFYIDILTMRHFWFMNALAIAYIKISMKKKGE